MTRHEVPEDSVTQTLHFSPANAGLKTRVFRAKEPDHLNS